VNRLLSNCGRLLGFGKKAATPKGLPSPEDLNLRQLPVLSASELIQACGYAPDLPELFRLVGVQEQHFDNLYRDSLYAFAEAVQLAPASESHHHAGPGGLLKHTLEVVHSALQLRKAYQLPRRGEPESIVAQEHAWTFGVFAGALLHDAGKVMSRSPLILTLADGTERPWNPHDQKLKEIAPTSYRIAFRDASYKAHNRYALTLFGVILPSVARGWLTNYPHILSQLVAYLWGDEYESGDIGEIVVHADRDSTAKNLGGSPDALRFPDAKASTAELLIGGLRQLLGEKEIKLNQNGGMGWIHNDFAYFVCKPLVEKIQGYLASQGVTGIPTDSSRLYDILQEGGFALSTPDGQAIWSVTVQGNGYQHVFTCLKLEARRLFSHNRALPTFNGIVTETALTPSAAPSMQPVINQNSVVVNAHHEVQTTQSIAVPVSPVAAPSVTPSAIGQPAQTIAPQTRPETASVKESVPVSPLSAIQEKHQNTAVPVSEPAPVSAPSSTIQPISESVPAQETAPNSSFMSAPIGMPVSPVAANRSQPPQQQFEIAMSAKTAPQAAETQLTESASKMEENAGELFIAWIQDGVSHKKLQTNNSNAAIHFVEEGVLLISPKIFKVFCDQHGFHENNDFNKIQKRLIRLRMHIKGKLTGKNILTYIVKAAGGKEHRLNGMLLPYNQVFAQGLELPEKNKFLTASENN